MVKHIRATPSAVYAALVDEAAVQQWMVPNGMSSTVVHDAAADGKQAAHSLRQRALPLTGTIAQDEPTSAS